jgi:hypothetical protein
MTPEKLAAHLRLEPARMLEEYSLFVIDEAHLVGDADRGWVLESALPPAEGMRSHGFSGWYGLEAHRVNERIIQLARHHYHDTATLLEQTARASGAEPPIIAGHQDTIPQFLGVLPAGLRDHFAGSFVADPHTLTPAKVRDLAGRVIQDWGNLQDQHIAAEFLGEPPDGRTVTGLSACLAAAGQHAIQLLLVPAGGLVPGYACQRCGALSSTGDGCPHGAPESLAVPDLIEELAVATLGDGGQVETLCDPPGGIAARLRYAQPLPLWVTRSIGLDGAAWPAACTCCAADVPHRCVRVAAAGDVPGLPARWHPRSRPGSEFAGVPPQLSVTAEPDATAAPLASGQRSRLHGSIASWPRAPGRRSWR